LSSDRATEIRILKSDAHNVASSLSDGNDTDNNTNGNSDSISNTNGKGPSETPSIDKIISLETENEILRERLERQSKEKARLDQVIERMSSGRSERDEVMASLAVASKCMAGKL
jgi:hypothetical protein